MAIPFFTKATSSKQRQGRVTADPTISKAKSKPKPKNPQEVSTNIKSPGKPFLIWMASKTMGADARLRFYERLASPLEAGVGIQSAIGQLYQRAAFKSETETMAIMLRYVMFSLNEGKAFSDGLAPFIPLSELLIIKAGESRGDLAGSLFKAAGTVRSVKRIKSAVMGALAKPAIFMSLLLFAMYIVGSFVVPKISAVFPSEDWTGGAAALAVIGNWTASVYFPLSILCFILFVIFVIFTLKRWAGGFRKSFDKAPPYSLYRILQGAGWMTTLSAMLQSGRSIRATLQDLEDLARKDGNSYLSSRTQRIVVENERGAENIGIAMEKAGMNFPDEEIIADMVMQSSLSNFDERIGIIADQWIADSVEKVQRISGILTSVSLLAVGGFVLTFVLGVMSLNQQIASSMQGF